jgi:gliding motility-associated lipoprotein GldH
MKVRDNTRFLFIFLFILFLVSCNNEGVFYQYRHIDRGRWYSDSVIQFKIDATALNLGVPYDLSIEITSNGRYPYRDIWMQVAHNLTDTTLHYEEVHYFLADDFGRWLGDGVGGLYQLSLPLYLSVPLDTTYHYVIQLKHIMDDNPLHGIEKMGLKLEVSDKHNRGRR